MTTPKRIVAGMFGELAAQIMRRDSAGTAAHDAVDVEFAGAAARTAASHGLDVLGRFVVKCSWCGALMQDGDARAGISHSICATCKEGII